MPKGQSRQTYMNGSDFQAVTFKQDINIFQIMKIDNNIHEGFVENSFQKSTRSEYTQDGFIRKMRGRDTSLMINTYMDHCDVRRNKMYVDHLSGV